MTACRWSARTYSGQGHAHDQVPISLLIGIWSDSHGRSQKILQMADDDMSAESEAGQPVLLDLTVGLGHGQEGLKGKGGGGLVLFTEDGGLSEMGARSL